MVITFDEHGAGAQPRCRDRSGRTCGATTHDQHIDVMQDGNLARRLGHSAEHLTRSASLFRRELFAPDVRNVCAQGDSLRCAGSGCLIGIHMP